MLEKASMMDMEHLKTLGDIAKYLILSNVVVIVTGMFQAYVAWKKMRFDINQAHLKIRQTDSRVTKIEKHIGLVLVVEPVASLTEVKSGTVVSK